MITFAFIVLTALGGSSQETLSHHAYGYGNYRAVVPKYETLSACQVARAELIQKRTEPVLATNCVTGKDIAVFYFFEGPSKKKDAGEETRS